MNGFKITIRKATGIDSRSWAWFLDGDLGEVGRGIESTPIEAADAAAAFLGFQLDDLRVTEKVDLDVTLLLPRARKGRDA